MTRNNDQSGRTKRRVVLTGPTKRRVDRTGLAQALGAAEIVTVTSADDTPLGFVAVRQRLMDSLRSTGGRPGIPEAERRKIPVTETVWRAIADTAAGMAEPGFHPSPAQVASVILTIAVRHLTPDLREETKHALKAARSLQADQESASSRQSVSR